MTAILLVALGGAVGAALRYGIVRLLPAHFPWGVLLANVLGSLLFGVILAGASHDMRLLAMVGFCGALTTFSTFALDTLVLGREGRPGAAVANIALSTAACIGAVAAGLAIGQALGLSG